MAVFDKNRFLLEYVFQLFRDPEQSAFTDSYAVDANRLFIVCFIVFTSICSS